MTDVMRVFRQELARRRSDRQNLETGAPELNQETVEVLRSLGYVR